MKRRGLILLIALFSVGFAIAYCLSLLPGVSLAEEEEGDRIFDFGRVYSGDVVRHEFMLFNDMAKARRVTATKTTCGCTVVERAPDVLSPHSSVAFSVSVNTEGKSGPTNQSVLLQLDGQEWVVFQITGFIEGARFATLDFGNISRSQAHTTMQFAVKSSQDAEIKVTNISFDKGLLTINQDTQSKAEGLIYTVGLADNLPYGPFSNSIKIETTDTINPVKSVVAKGNVLYPVLAEPRELMLGDFQVGEVKSGSIRFYSPIGRPVSIEEVKLAGGDPAEWKIEPLPNGEQSVVVTMKRDESTRKVFKAVLTIKAKSVDQTLPLKIEVYGIAAQ